MSTIDVRTAVGPDQVDRLSTEELRNHFLVSTVFSPDRLTATCFEYDRMVILGAQPMRQRLEFSVDLAAYAGTRHFLDRRELGILNVGRAGRVVCGDDVYDLGTFECLYLGRDSPDPGFESVNPDFPARFYMNSVPAHARHPPGTVRPSDLKLHAKGVKSMANGRATLQYLHPDVRPTSQLALGLTRLDEGAVWSSVPPHLHPQRTEACFYFDLPDDSLVFHIMGRPAATRHVVVRNEQAVISPPWSIHSGAGLSRFAYVWTTAGENLDTGYGELPAMREFR